MYRVSLAVQGARGSTAQARDRADSKEDDLDDGAVEELLFGWY
jgi:hypothetical protein